MMHALLLIAALTAPAQTQQSPVQTKNGEFIFRQYPPRARAAGEQGSVRFQAEVDAKGNVMSCRVTASSGYRRLDDETCEMIIDHASFKPTLDSKGKARKAIHDGIVNWRLPGNGPEPQPQLASAKVPDKIICRRIPRTGSLIAGSRLCLTRREWAEAADRYQDHYGEFQGKFGSTHDGQATFPSDLPGPGRLSGGYSPPQDQPR
jgi:protein TonB